MLRPAILLKFFRIEMAFHSAQEKKLYQSGKTMIAIQTCGYLRQ